MSNEDKNILLPLAEVEGKLLLLCKQPVIRDADVATLYGVATREINQAVKNNPEKFPEGYILEVDKDEMDDLKSKFLISNTGEVKRGGRRYLPKAFTEKGLYMLATILKGKKATAATISIVETYAKVRALKNDLVALHQETDASRQRSLMGRFSEALTDIVMPDLRTEETESTLELNFIIGKIKHTVKRKRAKGSDDQIENKKD